MRQKYNFFFTLHRIRSIFLIFALWNRRKPYTPYYASIGDSSRSVLCKSRLYAR